MSKKSNTSAITWAQLRFSIIGGLLARPPCKGQLGKELQILAGRHYRHPTQDIDLLITWSQFFHKSQITVYKNISIPINRFLGGGRLSNSTKLLKVAKSCYRCMATMSNLAFWGEKIKFEIG